MFPEAALFGVGGILVTLIILWTAFRFIGGGIGNFVRGEDPASRMLAGQIEAARAHNCSAVWGAYSSRTRELMMNRSIGNGGRALSQPDAANLYCNYAPTTAKLDAFLPESVALRSGGQQTAIVTAVYTYDRFFGFFGRGRSRAPFQMVLEEGSWRVDATQELDPDSAKNKDTRAMFLLHQAFTAERDTFVEVGFFTADAETIREQLPGFEFPAIVQGVASEASNADVIYVATSGDKVVCISIRSSTGTLVMVKDDERTERKMSYQWGSIPNVCDKQPLKRPYYGASSGIGD